MGLNLLSAYPANTCLTWNHEMGGLRHCGHSLHFPAHRARRVPFEFFFSSRDFLGPALIFASHDTEVVGKRTKKREATETRPGQTGGLAAHRVHAQCQPTLRFSLIRHGVKHHTRLTRPLLG